MSGAHTYKFRRVFHSFRPHCLSEPVAHSLARLLISFLLLCSHSPPRTHSLVTMVTKGVTFSPPRTHSLHQLTLSQLTPSPFCPSAFAAHLAIVSGCRPGVHQNVFSVLGQHDSGVEETRSSRPQDA